jgi:hypothetical protein
MSAVVTQKASWNDFRNQLENTTFPIEIYDSVSRDPMNVGPIAIDSPFPISTITIEDGVATVQVASTSFVFGEEVTKMNLKIFGKNQKGKSFKISTKQTLAGISRMIGIYTIEIGGELLTIG